MPSTDSRILLVEDDSALRRVLQLWLASAGRELTVAQNAEEANERAGDEGPFELLLVDVGLPRIDGWQLSQQLMPGFDIPNVLYMSAISLDTHHSRGRNIPEEKFLFKPFSRDHFLKRVSEILD